MSSQDISSGLVSNFAFYRKGILVDIPSAKRSSAKQTDVAFSRLIWM
jgi:hypothetical protein